MSVLNDSNIIELFISCGNETISIKSEIDQTISNVKKLINNKLQLSSSSLSLYCNDEYDDNNSYRLVTLIGKTLLNSITLQYYLNENILQYNNNTTLNLLVNLNGGGKKKRKRKKVILRPRKGDHQHCNIPLAPITMKHYEFNYNIGKMCCNRMNCPKCGVGCLMANHDNVRHYCGKCHLVLYIIEKSSTKSQVL